MMVFHLKVLVPLDAKLSANYMLLRLQRELKILEGFFHFITVAKQARL